MLDNTETQKSGQDRIISISYIQDQLQQEQQRWFDRLAYYQLDEDLAYFCIQQMTRCQDEIHKLIKMEENTNV